MVDATGPGQREAVTLASRIPDASAAASASVEGRRFSGIRAGDAVPGRAGDRPRGGVADASGAAGLRFALGCGLLNRRRGP
ncbi:hypothetical protein, partial [Amycolatopsis sp. NPDC003676]